MSVDPGIARKLRMAGLRHEPTKSRRLRTRPASAGRWARQRNDHFDELVGATELFIYQTPNRRTKGFDALKLFLEANECEVLFTTDVPPNCTTTRPFASPTSAARQSPTLSSVAPTPGPTTATSSTASSSPCTASGSGRDAPASFLLNSQSQSKSI